MAPNSVAACLRVSISNFLNDRSVIRDPLRPTRQNTIKAVLIVLAAVPLAPIIALWLMARRTTGAKATIIKLPIRGEFGFFICFMEALRGRTSQPKTQTVILALSKWPHKTLTKLYKRELSARILWSTRFQVFVQQALLLQPQSLIDVSSLSWKSVFGGEYPRSLEPLKLPISLYDYGSSLTTSLVGRNTKLVPFAIHTRQYDLERNPEYALKGVEKESDGSILAEVIDYLLESQTYPVMLGSPDTGKTTIARKVARLSDFGELGGIHEVLISRFCDYFWTDSSGAWWLSFPFQKPVLFSNQATFRLSRWVQPSSHIVIPIVYQLPDGRRLTIREELAAGVPFASWSNLTWIHNSADDIISAHKEMVGLLDGTWRESAEMKEVRNQYLAIFSDYPNFYPCRVSSMFLLKNQYLLGA